MNKVFSGQTKLTLTVNLATAIPDVVTAVLEYETSQGTRGEWPATIANPTTGVLTVDFPTASQSRPAGRWKVWPKLTYADGKVIYGTVSQIDFHLPGTA